MVPKVIVSCGSGIATSQAVARKVSKLLRSRGVEADVVPVDIKELKQSLVGATAYVAIVKTEDEFKVPVFNGVSFLTGIGQEAELDRLVDSLTAAKA